MNIADLFTVKGFSEALKAHHQRLHAQYNFPPLKGEKPLHKFAEVFGFKSAEPFMAALRKHVQDQNRVIRTESEAYIVITQAYNKTNTLLATSYNDALNMLRDLVKSECDTHSSPSELLENFDPIRYESSLGSAEQSLNIAYQEAFRDFDEDTLSEIYMFIHDVESGCLLCEIRKSLITSHQPKTRLELLMQGEDIPIEDMNRIKRSDGWHVREDSDDYIEFVTDKSYGQGDNAKLSIMVFLSRRENLVGYRIFENNGSDITEYIMGQVQSGKTIRETLIVRIIDIRSLKISRYEHILNLLAKEEFTYHQLLIAAQGLDDFLSSAPK